MVAVRYIVRDAAEAAAFYAEHLGFEVVVQGGAGFAMLQRDDLRLLLNAPGAGGAGTAGGSPEPGGWNRFQLEVEDLEATVARLQAAGCPLRGGIVQGNGGDQALVEDPSGNVVELLQPKR